MKNVPRKHKSPAHIAWLKKKNAKKNAKRTENKAQSAQAERQNPPMESFREMEICPSPDELLGIEKLPVRKNTGLYQNAEDYLDLQFRLLREDFVRPLREALANIRARDESHDNPPPTGARVYTGVRFEKLVRDFRTLSIIVKIDIDQINLANEKLFMFGSLLCFSETNDNFQNVVLAKVCDCYPGLLRKGLIKVTLINLDEIVDINFGVSYSMFESEVFFEPYFRVLTALQTMALDYYPMCHYVTGKAKTIHTINHMRWGPNDNPGLNPTQFKGYQSALSNNLTLIQGPPGTGKTYLGLKVVQRMIELNEEVEVAGGEKPPPILVICATNHALDQFLEHIVNFCTDVIRIGGQSESVALVDYMMKTKRRQYRKANKELARMMVDYEYSINKIRIDIDKKVKRLNKDKMSIENQTELEDEILLLIDEIQEQMNEYQGCKLEKDLVIMKDARLVGMTTTSAARLRPLLDNLQPSIMIVEEAAEVLEGHIVGALTKHCRHVVLIGDHQQLRPITSCHRLSKEYQLDISLFERLCKNGVPYITLDVQHRMRPEFAQLLVPTVYEKLCNDRSVLNRPNVIGVEKNLFFVTHLKPEESAGWSKRNLHEAEFLMALCQYLILQGHAPEKITIIAMYAAQVTELENLRAKQVSLNGVVISSVDGYQGEENDIVLLSLVRSNKSAQIGFLWTVNRICVALSRARFGLYIIGNMENLTRDRRSVWCRINKPMTQSRAVGTHLTLRCSVHNSLKSVSCASDFKLDAGGCGLGCGDKQRLPGSLESLLSDFTLDDKTQQTLVYTNGNLAKSASMQDILDVIERQAGRKVTPPKGAQTASSNVRKNQPPGTTVVQNSHGLAKPVSQVTPTKAKHFFAVDFEPEPLLKPQAAVTPFRVDRSEDKADCLEQKPLTNGDGPKLLEKPVATATVSVNNSDLRGSIQREMEEFDRQTMLRRNELLARVLSETRDRKETESLNKNRSTFDEPRSCAASVQPVSRIAPLTRRDNPIVEHPSRVDEPRRVAVAGVQVVASSSRYNPQPSHFVAPSAPQMDDYVRTGAIPRTRPGEVPRFLPREQAAPIPQPRSQVHQTTTIHHVYSTQDPASNRPIRAIPTNHFAATGVEYASEAVLIGEHRRQWPQAAPPVVEKPKKKSTCVMM